MQQLRSLQEWMQSCLMTVDPPEDHAVIRRIRPSFTMSAGERLDIYRGMYELRLIEALQTDYPGLLWYLGQERFDEVARLYVRHCPSQSYTLNRLGDRLPEFLLQVEGLKRAAFFYDLARFELAETVVFDEEASTPALPDGLDEKARLRPIAGLRLLAMRYPANRYLKGDSGAIPRRRDTWVAVYRQGYSITHLELSRGAFELCSALCSGQTIGEAVAASKLRERAIYECFQQWFSLGWFQARQ